MHRVDTEGHDKNKFSDGDPSAAVVKPATVLGADWLNAVQEEIAGFIETQGIAMQKSNNSQLGEAVRLATAQVVSEKMAPLQETVDWIKKQISRSGGPNGQ